MAGIPAGRLGGALNATGSMASGRSNALKEDRSFQMQAFECMCPGFLNPGIFFPGEENKCWAVNPQC